MGIMDGETKKAIPKILEMITPYFHKIFSSDSPYAVTCDLCKLESYKILKGELLVIDPKRIEMLNNEIDQLKEENIQIKSQLTVKANHSTGEPQIGNNSAENLEKTDNNIRIDDSMFYNNISDRLKVLKSLNIDTKPVNGVYLIHLSSFVIGTNLDEIKKIIVERSNLHPDSFSVQILNYHKRSENSGKFVSCKISTLSEDCCKIICNSEIWGPDYCVKPFIVSILRKINHLMSKIKSRRLNWFVIKTNEGVNGNTINNNKNSNNNNNNNNKKRSINSKNEFKNVNNIKNVGHNNRRSFDKNWNHFNGKFNGQHSKLNFNYNNNHWYRQRRFDYNQHNDSQFNQRPFLPQHHINQNYHNSIWNGPPFWNQTYPVPYVNPMQYHQYMNPSSIHQNVAPFQMYQPIYRY